MKTYGRSELLRNKEVLHLHMMCGEIIRKQKNGFMGQTWTFGEGAATKAWRAVLSGVFPMAN